MKLKYETAVATLVQFVLLTFLNIATGLSSVVSECHKDSTNCVSNLLVSLIFFLLISLWFGFIWILGFAAQDRRSKRLARVLIAAEVFIALIAVFNAKHHTNVLGLITSLIDLALALWVITLAYRLSRADGGRIMSKPRTRQRRHSITPKL
ncbi:MAG: hypothetical protein ABI602_03740 [Candidatus Saccharibacteria bacterium]